MDKLITTLAMVSAVLSAGTMAFFIAYGGMSQQDEAMQKLVQNELNFKQCHDMKLADGVRADVAFDSCTLIMMGLEVY